MRVIDLPADAGAGMGLLEHVPDGLTPGAFADHLKQAATTHYGHYADRICCGTGERSGAAHAIPARSCRDTLASELRVQVSDGKSAAWRNGSLLLPLGELATAFWLTGWGTGRS